MEETLLKFLPEFVAVVAVVIVVILFLTFIKDQAKALKSLPTPGSCQDIVRKSTVSDRQEPAPADSDEHDMVRGRENETPCHYRAYDAENQPVSPPGRENKKWRRRESNPRPATHP